MHPPLWHATSAAYARQPPLHEVDDTHDEPFQYWPEAQEVCVCVYDVPEQPEINSVVQLFTVWEPESTYVVILLSNQPLPIEWQPLPRSPISSVEQLPVAVTVFVCVSDVTQADPFQYCPEEQEV